MIFVAKKKKILPTLLVLLLDPGWIKIRIQDKHPGSATLGGSHVSNVFTTIK
jgi:hypothetical protein